jgi:hypothetical protein
MKKDEFLAYYYKKMVGRCSLESTGLKTTTHKRVRDTYQQCYSKYIKKRRLAPPKSFWEEHQNKPWRAARKGLTGLTRLVRREITINTGAPYWKRVPFFVFEQVPTSSERSDFDDDDTNEYDSMDNSDDSSDGDN